MRSDADAGAAAPGMPDDSVSSSDRFVAVGYGYHERIPPDAAAVGEYPADGQRRQWRVGIRVLNAAWIRLDDDPAKHGSELLGHPVLGPIDLGSTLSESWFINGIGSPASFLSRRGIVEKVSLGVAKRWETLLHPTASVSRFSTVGAGSVLFQHVTVNSRSSVGKHVLISVNLPVVGSYIER